MMPMSEEAATGLRATVEWNPTGARYLMHILRDLPIGVRYKEQDRYGPLGMMLFAVSPTTQITHNVSIPRKPAPFPQEKLAACEVFNAEWLQRRFTKSELATAIEQILAEVEQPPLLEETNAQATLILTPHGTFLNNDIYRLDSDGRTRIDEET